MEDAILKCYEIIVVNDDAECNQMKLKCNGRENVTKEVY